MTEVIRKGRKWLPTAKLSASNVELRKSGDGEEAVEEVVIYARREEFEEGEPRVVHVYKGSSLAYADLHGVDLMGADLDGISLNSTNLAGANLINASMRGCDLCGANLDRATFMNTVLDKADLSGASAKKADFTKASLKGAELMNVNLEGANLVGAQMDDANFAEANLTKADLTMAHLNDAKFYRANLQGADLFRARLRHAVLAEADLRGANFGAARLQDATLSDANARGAKFDKARLDNARLMETEFGHCEECDETTSFQRTVFGQALYAKSDKNTREEIVALLSHGIVSNILFEDPIIGRQIRDQAYINALNAQAVGDRWLTFVMWLWWVSSDYGRSTSRWLFWAMAIVGVFGAVYTIADYAEVDWLDYGDDDLHRHKIFSNFYFSVVIFTTLGFGDIHPQPDAWVAQLVVWVQVVLGYLMLGGLLAIFSQKLSRRND